EAADAAAMQRAHHLRQLGEIEADLRSRRKVVQPKVDRVRARFNGGAQLWPVSGRAHDLGLMTCGHYLLPSRAEGYLQVNIRSVRPLFLFLPMLALAQTNVVKSPDGAIELTLSADGGALSYTVSFHGNPV